MHLTRALIFSTALFLPALAQNPAAVVTPEPTTNAPRRDTVHQVDSSQMYHRVYARVPLQGVGTKDDPIRPMFIPPNMQPSSDRSGILAWQMQLSDDGKWALVEYVGATPKQLASITSSADPNIKVFERGKATQAEIEAEFQKYKKGFTLSSFQMRVQ